MGIKQFSGVSQAETVPKAEIVVRTLSNVVKDGSVSVFAPAGFVETVVGLQITTQSAGSTTTADVFAAVGACDMMAVSAFNGTTTAKLKIAGLAYTCDAPSSQTKTGTITPFDFDDVSGLTIRNGQVAGSDTGQFTPRLVTLRRRKLAV